MNEYTPDRWIVIEIESTTDLVRKVLAGWSGGYLDADHWRISSGITKVVECDDYYLVHNESGSVYTCFKNSEGVTNLSGSVLHKWSNQADDRDDISIKTIDIKDLIINNNNTV